MRAIYLFFYQVVRKTFSPCLLSLKYIRYNTEALRIKTWDILTCKVRSTQVPQGDFTKIIFYYNFNFNKFFYINILFYNNFFY